MPRTLLAGDTIEAQVSGFCGGPRTYERIQVTKVSANGSTWWGTTKNAGTEISGSTGDVTAWWPRSDDDSAVVNWLAENGYTCPDLG